MIVDLVVEVETSFQLLEKSLTSLRSLFLFLFSMEQSYQRLYSISMT